MKTLRRLPSPLKSILKKFLSYLGLNQGSLYKPDSKELEILISLVDLEKYESRNGKCISSRHFDAIAAGTWQILSPGEYSNIIFPKLHYTEFSVNNYNQIQELIKSETARKFLHLANFETLYVNNSYTARVAQILKQVIVSE